jgi:hypothetical protein
MKYVWMILLMLSLTLTLLACQAAEPASPAPQERMTQTDSPGALPESSATQALTPTLPQENRTMVPVTPPDEASEKMVVLVKQHLAQRLSIAIDQIVLLDIKSVVWRDAGLGCPKPGIDYIQAETPGYNILLEASGATYRYHTDQTKRFVQCNR